MTGAVPDGASRIGPGALVVVVGPSGAGKDTLIGLAYMPEDELESFAGSSPEADAVIGGPTGQAIAPAHVGPTLMAAATNKGKFVIELKLPTSDGPGQSKHQPQQGRRRRILGALYDGCPRVARLIVYANQRRAPAGGTVPQII